MQLFNTRLGRLLARAGFKKGKRSRRRSRTPGPSARTRWRVQAQASRRSRTNNLCAILTEDWLIPRHEVQIMDSPFRVGGFGKIYHGTWLGSRVVIKLIVLVSSKTRHEFLREAAIWKKLHHPHVIQLYGACMSFSEQTDNPGLFICEEAENGSLRDFLFNERQAGRSPPVWRTLRDAALGLRYLHQRGIVHGDLKGNNILVSKSGVAKLTDFGLSSIPDQEGCCGDPCEAAGAFQWKAPELFGANCSAATFESDIYAFGMCIVEALRGGLPWGALPDAAVKYSLKKAMRAASKPGTERTISQVLPRPVNVKNDRHWAFVEQLCAFDPSERLKLPDAIKILDQFALDEATEAFSLL